MKAVSRQRGNKIGKHVQAQTLATSRKVASFAKRASHSVVAQERLAQLLPKHAQPVEPGACTWMQWAFACVRSRAFRLGPECHAIIPFVDMANHALPPVAAFRPHQGAIELLAVREVAAGDEATISYALADRCVTED